MSRYPRTLPTSRHIPKVAETRTRRRPRRRDGHQLVGVFGPDSMTTTTALHIAFGLQSIRR